MRGKKLLATFLLGAGLCFVPALGYGEVNQSLYESKARAIDIMLLKLQIAYLMNNPTGFLCVDFSYDPYGSLGKVTKFPDSIDTKGKIFVHVKDNRGRFSAKSKIALRDEFKSILESLFSYLEAGVATDMDTDIVAKFLSREAIPLGYFYQGEYHLWGE